MSTDTTQLNLTHLNSTQLDMYWLKTQINSTQLNWTDMCSSARVRSSRDPVGIKYRSTIDNLYKQMWQKE